MKSNKTTDKDTKRIAITVSKEEAEMIEAKAKANNLTSSRYLANLCKQDSSVNVTPESAVIVQTVINTATELLNNWCDTDKINEDADTLEKYEQIIQMGAKLWESLN